MILLIYLMYGIFTNIEIAVKNLNYPGKHMNYKTGPKMQPCGILLFMLLKSANTLLLFFVSLIYLKPLS